MTAEATTMRKGEYARYRGVSPALVSRWRARNRIVIDGNGRVCVAASDALLNATADPARAGELRPRGQASPTSAADPIAPLRNAKLRSVLAGAARLERENAVRAGELVPVAPLAALIERLLRDTAQALDAIPHRAAVRLGIDVRVATHALEDEIRTVSADLAAGVRRIAAQISDGAAP